LKQLKWQQDENEAELQKKQPQLEKEQWLKDLLQEKQLDELL
jgi:hypothetical protein